jgi:hypothetical protein
VRTAFLIIGVAAAVALAPGSALASEPPTCDDTRIWVRPDRERAIELPCRFVWDARLVDAPDHATVSDLRVEGGLVRWTQTTQAGAPADDAMTLELTGGEERRTHELAVTVVPLSQNTAPVCDPVEAAKRGPGDAPVEVSFFASCRDAEHDRLTMEGSGPGTFTFAPPTVAGGVPAPPPSWTYRTATFDGTEEATLSAVDELGARSATAPIRMLVGPSVDSSPRCFGWGPIADGALAEVVYGRPGVPRRIQVGCSDPDRDDMSLRIAVPPGHGEVEVTATDDSYNGIERSIVWTLLYTPAEPFAGTDEFMVETSQAGGEIRRNRIEMRYRERPENFPPECRGEGGWLEGVIFGPDGWLSPHQIWSERPIGYCTDPDGDPLQFTITKQPDPWRVHFRPDPLPGLPDRQELMLERTNAYGRFDGAFTVTDGLEPVDLRLEFGFRFYEHPYTPYTPPAAGAPPTTAAAAPSAADQARTALGTRKVRLLRTLGGARVYAPAARTRIRRRIAPLAVTCATTCAVRGRLQPAAGAKKGRRTIVRGTARAGRPMLLRRSLTAAERRALRRAGGGKLAASLSVREAGRKARAARLALTLRR